MLGGAEQIAGAADLQIAHRQPEPGAQLRHLLDHAQPPLRRLVETSVGRDEQVRVRLLPLAPHAPAQLVELGEAETIGPVDDDGVGRRDVEPRFHDGRGDEDVDLAVDELDHHRLQLALGHLAMGHGDARLGAETPHEGRHGGQRLDAVVDEEDLPAPPELALDGLLDHAAAPPRHHGLHRQPIERRRLDHREVADPRHRHVERARDRRGGQRQHVHRGAQPLDPLLVAHTEPVLLVHHEETEVLEDHVLGEEAMGADHDVDRAPRQALDDRLLLPGTPEAREQLHAGWERPEALAEGVEVLLRQHGRGHQHGGLAAVGHRLEGRPQGHLGLAIADVAGHEAVHGARPAHVGLDLLDGAHLIRRLLEPERRLELALPGRVAGKGRALRHRAGRVQPQQLLCHLTQRGPDRFLHPLPRAAAETVQPGGALRRAHVLADEVQPLHRKIEPPAVGVLDQQEIRVAAVGVERPQAVIAPDAVVLVDHEVVGLEIREGRDGGAALEQRPAEPPALSSEDLVLG